MAFRKNLVFACVLLATFMAAVEGTIISTAMPSIIADLGGFALFSWAFSIFLLMQAATIPIYGKLADLYGRKPVFVAGTSLFLVGSLLCGFAETMPQLILFRAIQGLGAGAVQPVSMIIVGDIFTAEERAQRQGYISSVWGISSIAGPALGSLIVENTDWAWVFWINLPLGLLAIAGILSFLREEVEKEQPQLDIPGSALILVSVSALILAMVQGGVAWEWTSLPSLGLLGIFALGFVLFLWQERRAPEPMMPLELWRHPLIGLANLATFLSGMVLMGISSFLPAYVQGVMGRSAFVGGVALGLMSIGWPLASIVGSRLLLKMGLRYTSLLGGLFLVAGGVMFLLLTPGKGPVWASAGSFFIGLGMGFTATSFIISIQSSVEWSMRGAATASNMFMRTLGSTIGAALMGGIVNSRLMHYLRQHAGEQDFSADLDAVGLLLNPDSRAQMTEEALQLLREGMSAALSTVYLAVFLLTIAVLVLVGFLPKSAPAKAQRTA